MKWYVGCFLLLALTRWAVAESIYVCTDSSGRKIYNSEPCSGAQTLIKQEAAVPIPSVPSDDPAAHNRYSEELDQAVQRYVQAGDLQGARQLALTPLHWQWIQEAAAEQQRNAPAVIIREPVVLPKETNEAVSGTTVIYDGGLWGDRRSRVIDDGWQDGRRRNVDKPGRRNDGWRRNVDRPKQRDDHGYRVPRERLASGQPATRPGVPVKSVSPAQKRSQGSSRSTILPQ